MFKTSYQAILKWGALATMTSFFLVNKSLYFPYITGKQLYFNIIVELLMIVYVAYIIKFPEERPRSNWITWGLVAFFTALLISAIFGVDFNLSFWGDAERMLGWFQIIHFFLLYLIVITVFRTESDWKLLFISAVSVAVALSLYGLVTAEGGKSSGNVNMTSNISRLGNATYMAGLMIFNFFFTWYLFFKTRDWTARFLLIVASFIIMWGFFYADVSGSQAGWFFGLVTTLVIAGALNKNKKVKLYTWSALAVMIVIVVALFINRDSAVFDGNKVGKVLRDFNANNTTFRTRTYAWRAAWLGWQDNPLIGNGYGNFADHFDRHFVGSFYEWGTHEEYYDRAHNNLLDILSTTGLLGLLSYLSIFVALAYYLIKGVRAGTISTLEVSTMAGVFVGYFIHNLAVFDAIANYVMLFFSLAFVYYLANRSQVPAPKLKVFDDSKAHHRSASWESSEIQAWCFVGLLSLFIIYNYNLQPWWTFRDSVKGASAWINNPNPQVAWDLYRQAMSYQTPLDRDCRMLWSGNIVSNPNKLTKLSLANQYLALDYAISLIEQNLELNPNDSLTLSSLTRVQVIAYQLTSNPKYLVAANDSIDRSIASGGQHIPHHMIKLSLEIAQGNWTAARAKLAEIRSFFNDYPLLICYDAKIDLMADTISEATYQALNQCFDSDRGPQTIGYLDKLTTVEQYYRQAQDFQHLAVVYEIMLSVDQTNQALWQKLFDAYRQAGQTEKLSNALQMQKEMMEGLTK